MRVGQLALTVLVTWFIAHRLGLSLGEAARLDPARWRPRPWTLAASCALLLGGQVFSGLLWGRVVRDLGGTSLSFREAVRVFFVANLGRYVPGKVWQVTGLAVLARRRGVPATLSGIAAVVAHGTSLLAATLVGALIFGRAGPEGEGSLLWIPAALFALTCVALLPPVFRRLVGLASRLRLAVEWDAVRPRTVARWLGLFLIHWTIYGAAFVLLARSFGLPGGALEVASAFVAAYVIGYVAIFAPAGLGVREASLAALLAPMMGEGAATGLAVIARVWSTVVEIAPAAVLWLWELTVGRGDPAAPDDGG